MNKRILIAVAVIFLLIDCVLFTVKLNQEHKPKPIHKAKPHYKYSIYLTSDDGPLLGSKNLNHLIKDYEVPLSLFLVGQNIIKDPKLEAYLEDYKNNPYVILANHSFSHANLHYKRFYKNPSNVEADFLKGEETLGLNYKIARLPGRNVWVLNQELQKGEPNALRAAKKLYQDYGYRVFGWDYELRHNGKGKILKDAKTHYENIKKLLKSGKTYQKNQIVILMHDQMFTNSASTKVLGELILLLQNDDECKLKLIKDYKIN